jgi:hypothetical protein
MSEHSLYIRLPQDQSVDGGAPASRTGRRRMWVPRALSHARDEKAFQDAVRTGRFTEGELVELEREFEKVHRRRPCRK